MTQNVEIPKHVYVANGVITDFAYTFTVLDTDDVKVYRDNIIVSDTLYTVNTGTLMIEFDVAPLDTEVITIIREIPRDQTSDLSSDPFESAIDRIQRQMQDMQEQLDRGIRIRRQDTKTLELPALVANKFIKMNPTADGVIFSQSEFEDFDADLVAADNARIAAELAETNAAISAAAALVSELAAAASAATVLTRTLLTEQVTTTGADFFFDSLPAGIQKIELFFEECGTDSTTLPIVLRLGDSGGYENADYLSWATRLTSGGAAFFSSVINFVIIPSNSGTVTIGTGKVTLDKVAGTNKWIISGETSKVSAKYSTNGSKTLSGELDRLQIRTTSGAFNNGTFNMAYWN